MLIIVEEGMLLAVYFVAYKRVCVYLVNRVKNILVNIRVSFFKLFDKVFDFKSL